MKMKLVVFASSLALFPLAVLGIPQVPKGGTPAPSAGPRPIPPADPGTLINRDWNNLSALGRSGDKLTGTVAVAGGALPWEPVLVMVTCDGKARFTTNTDRKGFFIISGVDAMGSTTINANPKPVADQYLGCIVTAEVPGFNSTTLPIATRHVMDSPNLGTITLRREDGGSGLSGTTSSAPKDAIKAFEKARVELLDSKLDLAQRDLQKAVQIYPGFAEAWYQLGRIQESANLPDASNSFSKAIAADPKFLLPYPHLATLSAAAGNWQDVVTRTDHALAIDPRGGIDIFYYNALANFQLKNLGPAEASATKALAMDPLHRQPNTEQVLALTLYQKGDSAAALQHLRNCATYFAPGPNLDLVHQQIATVEANVKK
jgi:hypothetical protein